VWGFACKYCTTLEASRIRLIIALQPELEQIISVLDYLKCDVLEVPGAANQIFVIMNGAGEILAQQYRLYQDIIDHPGTECYRHGHKFTATNH
jgi:hypothetical protein